MGVIDGVGLGVGVTEAVGVGEGVAVGVGLGAGAVAVMLPNFSVVANVLSPIAPEANVESVVVSTRMLFTYRVIVFP